MAGQSTPEFAVRTMVADDVKDVAALHQQFFPEYFLTRMGGAFLRRFYREFVDQPGNCASVAVIGGRIVGFVAGSANCALLYHRFYRRNFLAVVMLVAARFIVDSHIRGHIFKRMAHVRMAVRSVLRRGTRQGPTAGASEPRAALLSIAVDPAHRGRGIAEKLTDHFCEQLRRHGVKKVGLTALPENARAIAFYEKSGWQREATTPDSVSFSRILSE